MFKPRFLGGISAIALAAGTASAQNTISSTGSGNNPRCTNGATTGNVCKITQTGNNDTATVTQSSDSNQTEVVQTGNGNSIVHFQGGSTSNLAVVNESGDSNSATTAQRGSLNDARIDATGTGLQVVYGQSGGTSATPGSGNTLRITVTGGPAASNTVSVGQTGDGNTMTIVSNNPTSGLGNRAFAAQGSAVFLSDGTPVDTRRSNFNTLSININGGAGAVDVRQRANGADGLNQIVSGNSATISMNNSNANGNFSSATLFQQSSGNTATIIVNDGGRVAGLASTNASTVTQRNAPGADSQIVTANSAFVSLSNGSQMVSTVTQAGVNNSADVTLTSGVAGTEPAGPGAPPGGYTGGNTSAVTQNGAGSTAYVSIQAPRGSVGQGYGNGSTINQTATLSYAPPTGTSQPAGTTGTGEPSNINGSQGQYATVWQQGQYARVTINQNDGGAIGAPTSYTTGSGTVVGRPRAAIFQAGRLMTATVTQTGDNYGEITQGQLGAGTGSTITLTQIDAGDLTPAAAFGQPAPTPVRGYNRSLITQYGDGNTITASQNTISGYQSLFQKVGSSGNVMQSSQGTGSSGLYSSAAPGSPPVNSTVLVASPATGVATRGLSATMTQAGSGNGLRASQDGANNTITVEQLGNGTPLNGTSGNGAVYGGAGTAGNQAGNIIQMAQQSNGNTATARQAATVGSSSGATGTPDANNPASGNSGDRYYFAGGARSPEIDIFQSGSDTTVGGATVNAGGNTAFAEQRGKGQYARIEQTGTRNTAGILQDTGATNATAAISQSGDSNSYYIVQTAPGQYLDVTQTGNGNSAANVTQRGAAGGSDGFAPPPGFPSF